MSSIFDWSTTAASNSNSDGAIVWSDGQAPSSVDDSGRAMMGRVAEIVKDLGGALTAGGTANALTVTANSAFTTNVNGRFLALRIATTNTAASTLSVNSIGAKAIRKMLTSGESALVGNEMRAGGIYIFEYSEALNSAAGAWLLLNPSLPPAFGRHNFLINGNFDIAQRGASFTPAANSDVYTLDRWVTRYDSGSGLTTTQVAHTVGQANVPGEPTYFIRLVSTGSTGGTVQLLQKAEDVRTLAGKTVTLAFYGRISSGTLAFTPFITQNFGGGGSADVVTNGTAGTLTTTFQKFTSVITLPSISGKTIGTDSFLKVVPHSVTAGARTVEFSRISLLEGDASAEADPFFPRHIRQEIANCQRYYEISSSLRFHGQATSGVVFGATAFFKVTKRATPTITQTNIGVVSFPAGTGNEDITVSGFVSIRTASATGAGTFNESWTAESEL